MSKDSTGKTGYKVRQLTGDGEGGFWRALFLPKALE